MKATDNELDLLKIAIEIMALNPETVSLTGSLMLCVRGIDKRREATDIDLLILDYAPNIKLPDGWEDKGYASDGTSQRVEKNGVKVDILSSGEKPELIDGVMCASVDEMVKVKKSYCNFDANPETRLKHKLDLGFMEITDTSLPILPEIELPF